MKEITKTERKTYIDLLKILCCISVVLIHVAATYWYDSDINTFDFKLASFIDSLVRFSVPVFFMVSGALFLDRKEINIKRIYKKNILNLLIILGIWLPVYGIVNRYRYNNTITGIASLIEIAKGLIDYQYQFWFIFTIITLYMCLPMLKKISEDKNVLKYFLVLFFIFAVMKPSLIPILGNGYKVKWLSLFYPDMIVGYTGYFLLGYYLYSTNLSKRTINISYILGIISVIVATVGTIYFSKVNGTHYDTFFGYFMITTALASVAVFNLFKYKLNTIKFKEKSIKITNKLAECTLGIYILHNLVKWFFEDNGFLNLFTSSLLAIPLFTLIIVIICVIITLILKKIPFIGKYII